MPGPRRMLPIIFAALAAAGQPALAVNWMPLMKNSPAERFEDDDIQMFIVAGRKVLNEASIGETVSWKNEETKHGGEFTLVKTFSKDNRACKQVRVHTYADGREAKSVVDACQIKDKWRLISPPRRMN